MATYTSKRLTRYLCAYGTYLSVIYACHVLTYHFIAGGYLFEGSDVAQIIENSCFVGINNDIVNHQSQVQHVLASTIEKIKTAFLNDEHVLVGEVNFESFKWPSGKGLAFKEEPAGDTNLFVIQKKVADRTCLSVGSQTVDPKAEGYTGLLELNIIVSFINEKCGTYRTLNGAISVEGLHRQEILRTLFHVENISQISMKDILIPIKEGQCDPADHNDIDQFRCSVANSTRPKSFQKYYPFENSNHVKIPQCDRIPFPSMEQFFHDFVKISKPVIFTDATKHWPAFQKWTNNYFRKKYGKKTIHIKLSPSGEYEGVDLASSFDNFNKFHIPSSVAEQLPFSDLVVVRPATLNMNFSDFIDLIESVANGSRSDISAYLEYSSISDIASELEEDVEELQFARDLLYLQHRNIWLSDGTTVGKLHFDPFDNLLCQISGRKQVLLFDPHDNRKLYEAHIPEANLHYDSKGRQFRKKTLVESTSMVMSPVDMAYPNLQRFPLFKDAYPLNCTIDEGEVLFMPAFWWHEVLSSPNMDQGRNLAVNFWYKPFLTREFPCQHCKLDVNPQYRHLL